MDRKFNRSSHNDSDKDKKRREGDSDLLEKSLWHQHVEIYREIASKKLNSRGQRLVEDYIKSHLGHQNERDVLVISDIKEGRISFAHEGMSKFPRNLVDVLRHDITHLDLSRNNIRNFEFLRGFKSLKSLIVDCNAYMNVQSLPPMDTLKLFYANKCNIEFPRSFIFHISVNFKSLKYLSMMDNPIVKRPSKRHIWEVKDHKMRMFAILMLPKLIHFNDKKITKDEREHSKTYHKYLGPIDCQISKCRSWPDAADMRNILPVRVSDKTLDIITMEDQDNEDALNEALAKVSVSDYFISFNKKMTECSNNKLQ